MVALDRRSENLRWRRDPSTACRKKRGTPVGMTGRERESPPRPREKGEPGAPGYSLQLTVFG